MQTEPIAGLILAGGRGLRMGGQDKGLLPLNGRPLAAHVLDALRPQVANVAVSANRNLDRYARLGVPVLADTVPGFPGPLAGMLAGLASLEAARAAGAGADWLLTAPCDTPALPPDLAARLLAAAEAGRARAAYALAGDRPQYVCCLLHRSLERELRARLDRGERAVHRFLESVGAVAVAFDNWPADAPNLNTPADFEQVAR